MMPIRRFLFPGILLLTALPVLVAQPADTLPRMQVSYGFAVWQPGLYVHFDGDYPSLLEDMAPGISFDVEVRLRRGISLLATLGTEADMGRAFYGLLPIPPVDDQEPGDGQATRELYQIDRKLRRTYLGLGAQANLRIGRGDLSLGALATFGMNRLRDVISVGDLRPRPFLPNNGSVRPPIGIPYSATVRFEPVWQTGMRTHLAYTYWVDRRFALRAGVYIGVRGGITLGNYERGEPDRFIHRGTTYSEDYNPAIHTYRLPEERLLNPGDPTLALWQTGFTLGMIYKPTLKRKP